MARLMDEEIEKLKPTPTIEEKPKIYDEMHEEAKSVLNILEELEPSPSISQQESKKDSFLDSKSISEILDEEDTVLNIIEPKDTFITKDIDPIGSPVWVSATWSYHQFGWYDDSKVYDACIRVDRFGTPRIPKDMTQLTYDGYLLAEGESYHDTSTGTTSLEN